MPLVRATESGRGQTELAGDESERMWSCRTCVFPSLVTQSSLERDAIEGDSPVEEVKKGNGRYPEYRSLDMDREFGWH